MCYSYLHICWHNAFENFFCGKWHCHFIRSSFSHNSIICIVIRKVNIYLDSAKHSAGARVWMKKIGWVLTLLVVLSPKITLKHKVLKSQKNMLNSFQDNIQVQEKEWSDLDKCVRRYEWMLCQQVSPLKGGVEPFLCPNTWMISPAGFSNGYRRPICRCQQSFCEVC